MLRVSLVLFFFSFNIEKRAFNFIYIDSEYLGRKDIAKLAYWRGGSYHLPTRVRGPWNEIQARAKRMTTFCGESLRLENYAGTHLAFHRRHDSILFMEIIVPMFSLTGRCGQWPFIYTLKYNVLFLWRWTRRQYHVPTVAFWFSYEFHFPHLENSLNFSESRKIQTRKEHFPNHSVITEKCWFRISDLLRHRSSQMKSLYFWHCSSLLSFFFRDSNFANLEKRSYK